MVGLYENAKEALGLRDTYSSTGGGSKYKMGGTKHKMSGTKHKMGGTGRRRMKSSKKRGGGSIAATAALPFGLFAIQKFFQTRKSGKDLSQYKKSSYSRRRKKYRR